MDEEIDVIVHEFFDKEYFLAMSVSDNNDSYDIYCGIDNQKDIVIAKNVKNSNGSFYEIISDEDKFIRILGLFQK